MDKSDDEQPDGNGISIAKEDDSVGGGQKKKKMSGVGFMSMSKNAMANRLSPKTQKKKAKASVALMRVFPNELEAQQEFEGFTEWLQTFELYRGKQVTNFVLQYIIFCDF
jgi:hypothetical protein